ncbi:MAG: exonuclease SbcCD subunit D [Streptosporangiales bacterium]|nr:exonuclease SbcCD subunit D [Streptosporangiales bacterium]
MRFLHTSDWHLGRSLHRTSLREAQEAFLDHLVETARDEKVDAVLVAGDIYDRALPPVDAVELCEDVLVRLRDTGARVIAISGNHDSARRLGFSSSLIDASGVHLRTRPAALADPVMLEDAHGPVAVYGIPYLEPAAEGEPGHEAAIGRAAARIREDAGARGAARTVVLAHAWVHGGQASDSERDISVGGAGSVPASLLDGFGYVALGHLHGQQTIAPNVRYSGSPLPYSFSEAAHKKGSWLVDIDAAGEVRAEKVPAPVYRRLSLLKGKLDDLLGSPAYGEYTDRFLAVTLTDLQRPGQAMDRLRKRFPHVLTLTFEPEGLTADGRRYGDKVKGKDDLMIATEFVRHVRNTPPDESESKLLAAAFENVRAGAR